MSFPPEKLAELEFLYGLYADKLYRIALSNLQHEEDASDVVHDVFIKYLNTTPSFKDARHQEGWFVTVTVNACRDLLRKKSHRNYTPIEEVHHLSAEEKEENEIVSYLLQLPEKYREVIILHYLEDYSVAETGKLLKISQSAVKMRLSRGRELLKNIMEGNSND